METKFWFSTHVGRTNTPIIPPETCKFKEFWLENVDFNKIRAYSSTPIPNPISETFYKCILCCIDMFRVFLAPIRVVDVNLMMYKGLGGVKGRKSPKGKIHTCLPLGLHTLDRITIWKYRDLQWDVCGLTKPRHAPIGWYWAILIYILWIIPCLKTRGYN